MELKKGDIVQLKSGGPKMTLEDFGQYLSGQENKEEAYCVWFVGTELDRVKFNCSSLIKVE